MKKTMHTLFALMFVTNLFASEAYPYIEPIAVEEPKVKRAVVQAPLDSDSVLDNVDKCPNTKQGEKVDKQGCLLMKDADNDGVPNKDDKCANTPKGTAVDYRGCELDSDDDGIVDSKDKCPNTSKEFVVGTKGCPQTATLKVNFAPGKYGVTSKIVNSLQEFALFLKENKGYHVVIYGYTDDRGRAKINKRLSQKRANSVKRALMRYKISGVRLTAIGKGEANPIADNETKEGRAKNRRIEVELLQ